MTENNIVQKVWSLCNVLRGDGISYHKYISELTYLLFLKIANETATEESLPVNYRWNDLVSYNGDNLIGFYQEMLTHLGVSAENKLIKEIYAFPTTVFSHSENLKVVIDGLEKIDWHSLSKDSIGQIYEGLLAKNSEDARSGAGQYFTPRSLVDAIVSVSQPALGEVIQDPAIGTGGFLISADYYIRHSYGDQKYKQNPPLYQGMEIERGAYRLCLMNTYLHKMHANVTLGDALTADAYNLQKADLILANPPFGSKAGSVRESREDIPYPTSNKQLAFLQHIYTTLNLNGRAAVVLPDNVLFEGNVGRKVRSDLMERCDLHTILRLPTGIFYAAGVKTNVLFFNNTEKKTSNVWYYDMRTNIPQFGKRKPLTEEHFKEFILFYGQNKKGTSKRIDQGENGRFRCFSREFISQREDNLDITWLKEIDSYNELSSSEPDKLVAAAITQLESAVADLNSVLEILNSEDLL